MRSLLLHSLCNCLKHVFVSALQIVSMCRVSARAELSLRQRLSQREDRICGLKDALAAAQHSPRQHLASHTQGRSRSPSPSAHVPDHAAYHSSAQSDRLLSHSRAVSGKHHTTFSSRPHVQLNSDQHQRHAQAEHSTARRSLERVHSDAEHVDSADQRQHGAEGQRHIARLPYFKPKAHGGIANSHDSGAHTKADQRSAQDTEIIARQKEFTQTLTGGCMHVTFELFITQSMVLECHVAVLWTLVCTWHPSRINFMCSMLPSGFVLAIIPTLWTGVLSGLQGL